MRRSIHTRVLLSAAVLSSALSVHAAPFSRGDVNNDGQVDIADTIYVLGYLFAHGTPPPCFSAADANDDGRVDLSDAVQVLLHIFRGGTPLPAPFGACGEDPTPDALECSSYGHCPVIPHEALAQWIERRPAVREALVWWEEGRGWIAYDAWSPELTAAFFASYDAEWYGSAPQIDPVPPNLLSPTALGSTRTVISRANAQALFFSLAIQSLLTELKGLVGWSLDAYDAATLGVMFDGRMLFKPNLICLPDLAAIQPAQPIPTTCAEVGFELQSSWGMPAPGRKAFDFLRDEISIAPTRVETTANLLEWARDGMLHFGGVYRADVAEYYWGYRGAVPAVRVMEGSDPAGFHPQSQEWGYAPGTGYDALFAHWTAGCHGTVIFMREVLRVINVPVRYELVGGHALPHFLGDDLYLSHADDLYSSMAKADYPARLLLIDAATHDAWFVNAPQPSVSIGRQVKVLAAIYLPRALLQYHCNDVAAGKPHESGSVYQYLNAAYTLDALDAMDFWSRMETEIASRGGCAALR